MPKVPEYLAPYIQPFRAFRPNAESMIIGTTLLLASVGAVDLAIDGNASNQMYNNLHPRPISRVKNSWDIWEADRLRCNNPSQSAEPSCLELTRRIKQYQQQQTDNRLIFAEYRGYLPGPLSSGLFVGGLLYAFISPISFYIDRKIAGN